MTTGRYPSHAPDNFALSQHYSAMDPYDTIGERAHSHAHRGHPHRHSALKASRSNNDVKYAAPPTCVPVSASGNDIGGGGGGGPSLSLGPADAALVKKGAWSSSLTVSRAREVYTNHSSHNQLRASAGSANLNLDRALVKSQGGQQREHTCHLLQVILHSTSIPSRNRSIHPLPSVDRPTPPSLTMFPLSPCDSIRRDCPNPASHGGGNARPTSHKICSGIPSLLSKVSV